MDTDKTNGNDKPAEAPLSVNDPEVAEFASKFKGFNFLGNNPQLFGYSGLVPYPPEVDRRLKALKNMQVEMFKTECKFYEELHQLEVKYADQHSKLCVKRAEIVTGNYEPTDDECVFNCGEEESEDKPEANGEGDKTERKTPPPFVKGVPKFWLTIFQNLEQFNDLIEPNDVPVLEHLEDIKMAITKEPMGFKLFFHFSPNDYFTNDCLTKTYEMRVEVDPKDPFAFEGTEIYKTEGCTIDWKPGKDLTKKEVKKKQKHKTSGAIRVTTKVEKCPTFFDFFNPPIVPEGEEEEDSEIQDRITLDFELASFLKERIIPRAVLYYTGEALDSEDEEEEEEDDEENYEDEEGDDEEETEGEEEAES